MKDKYQKLIVGLSKIRTQADDLISDELSKEVCHTSLMIILIASNEALERARSQFNELEKRGAAK